MNTPGRACSCQTALAKVSISSCTAMCRVSSARASTGSRAVCSLGEPASVSPGRIIVAPPRPSVSPNGMVRRRRICRHSGTTFARPPRNLLVVETDPGAVTARRGLRRHPQLICPGQGTRTTLPIVRRLERASNASFTCERGNELLAKSFSFPWAIRLRSPGTHSPICSGRSVGTLNPMRD